MINKTSLFAECKSTLGIIVIVLFLVFAFFDFTERVLIDANHVAVKPSELDVKILEPQLISSDFIAEIKKRYQQEQVEEDKKESGLPSLDEQLKQSGHLETVFSGNAKLSLKAVFNVAQSSAKYALISVEDIVANEREVIKVNDGEQLKGFNIFIVGNRAVNLSRINNKGDDITLVMYQQNQTNNK